MHVLAINMTNIYKLQTLYKIGELRNSEVGCYSVDAIVDLCSCDGID